MKASLRDHLTIVMAFAAVLLCGYGIGRMVAERPPPLAAPAQWEVETLSILKDSLVLAPAEVEVVEREIAATAAEIRATRTETVLAYHQPLDDLYSRLIARLGEEPASSRLRREQEQIQQAIDDLKKSNPEIFKPTEP